jgi:8-oxo-dGTP diphosphatase
VTLAALAALLDGEGRMLLVHQSYGARHWALPGGLLEPGESPQEAAVREVREEVGVDFEPATLVAVYTLRSRGLRFVFSGRFSGTPVVRDKNELTEIGWFPLDALPQPLAPSAPYAAREIAAGRVGAFRVIAARRAGPRA